MVRQLSRRERHRCPWRIYESTATTCHLQGTLTATGGGGDMEVDNTAFNSGQTFTVTSFTITAGNS